MPWLQLVLDVPSESAEPLSERLSLSGALAVTFQDAADKPLFEPEPGTTPLWDLTRVIGLYDAGVDIEAVARGLETEGVLPTGSWRIAQLEDKDWDRAWMDRFQPMRFGERVWIVPSWYTPPDPEAVNILLDPGLAFGTGTHATTRLCLEWLDAHPPEGLMVIDYGCGSGILAIAAAMLGAQHVWAVDNDPQALTATRQNADRCGVASLITTSLPGAFDAPPADVLVANILANPLIQLAPLFARSVRPEGSVVLSGILPEQAESVANAYRDAFEMNSPTILDGWARLEGRRRTPGTRDKVQGTRGVEGQR